MQAIPRLPEPHLARAREMVLEHRKRGKCKVCYDRGHRGVNQDNMLVPCHKCVDHDALAKTWRLYVRETSQLQALYGDYFEEELEETHSEAAGSETTVSRTY